MLVGVYQVERKSNDSKFDFFRRIFIRKIQHSIQLSEQMHSSGSWKGLWCWRFSHKLRRHSSTQQRREPCREALRDVRELHCRWQYGLRAFVAEASHTFPNKFLSFTHATATEENKHFHIFALSRFISMRKNLLINFNCICLAAATLIATPPWCETYKWRADSAQAGRLVDCRMQISILLLFIAIAIHLLVGRICMTFSFRASGQINGKHHGTKSEWEKSSN